MTLEILNLIIALCVGAPDRLACQKGLVLCHDKTVAFEQSRFETCEAARASKHDSIADREECLEKSGGAIKLKGQQAIVECLKSKP